MLNLSRAELIDGLSNGTLKPTNEFLAYLIVAAKVLHFGNMYEYRAHFPRDGYLFVPDRRDGVQVQAIRLKGENYKYLATRDLTLSSFSAYRGAVMRAAFLEENDGVYVDNYPEELRLRWKEDRSLAVLEP